LFAHPRVMAQTRSCVSYIEQKYYTQTEYFYLLQLPKSTELPKFTDNNQEVKHKDTW